MSVVSDLIARVRRELGDLGEPFQSSIRSDGETTRFDLPAGLVDTSTLNVFVVPAQGELYELTPNQYTLDGSVFSLHASLNLDDNLVVQGRSYAMFTDDEIKLYVQDALTQHLTGRTETFRYYDDYGFIKYARLEAQAEQLPEIEEYPVALLATIMALWTLATDAATDIDVYSGEGTIIPRRQRFAQVRSQIDALQRRYEEIATALNVGIHRIEVSTLRRVSRTTNRLVPVYVPREYDDHTWPKRVIPQIDQKDADESGVPSPNYGNEPW